MKEVESNICSERNRIQKSKKGGHKVQIENEEKTPSRKMI